MIKLRREKTTLRALLLLLLLTSALMFSLYIMANDDGKQSATRFEWGPVVGGDEFDGSSLDPATWYIVEGAGHMGNGRRAASQVKVAPGVLTITGLSDGTTGCIGMRQARQYGRWEVRMRVPPGSNQYHPVLILWPNDDKWPQNGEVDYAEADSTAARIIQFNYLSDNTGVPVWKHGERPIDTSQWHNYAVEWTPTAMRGYIDGTLFFEDTDRTRLPPVPMRQTIQLDWFPQGNETGKSVMEIAWVRLYN
jgi:beta-glucanase (GH16 family)